MRRLLLLAPLLLSIAGCGVVNSAEGEATDAAREVARKAGERLYSQRPRTAEEVGRSAAGLDGVEVLRVTAGIRPRAPGPPSVRSLRTAGASSAATKVSTSRTWPKRAPTLREAGLDTEFTNWRGIVAPPGLSDAEREKLVTLVTELHDSPQWRESLKTHGWNDAFLPGEEFGTFLAEQDRRVGSVLKELGL